MYLLPFVFSYLIGTISPGFFITKFYKHIDIRKFGARYTGAANVYRIAGFLPAILTGFIDFAKGVIAISLSFLFWDYVTPNQYNSYFLLVAAVLTIIGHIFPFYLSFKGGRGAATSYGVLFVSLIMLVYAGYPLAPILWLVFYTLILFFILHSFSFSGFMIDIAAFIIFTLFYLQTVSFKQSLMVSPRILFYILQLSLGAIILSSVYTYSKRRSLGIKLKNHNDPLLRYRIAFYFYALLIPFLSFIHDKIISVPILGASIIVLIFLLIKNGNNKRVIEFLKAALYFTLALFILCLFLKSKYILVISLSFSIGYILSDLVNRYTGITYLFGRKRSLEAAVAFFAFFLLTAIAINATLNLPMIILVADSLISAILFSFSEHQFEFLLVPLLLAITATFL
ncbi:MAG: hypothetical protein GWP03_04070 [Proteobacteria bacterium]|nr:hypothetical protein [Pseudomonadota bacterium]